MDKLLDFLANNYVYFLIAAGVLAFALIGFVVDLKKKEKKADAVADVPNVDNVVADSPVVPDIPSDVVAGPGSNDTIPNEVIPTEVEMVEDTLPGPPAPSMEETQVITPVTAPTIEPEVNQEPVINTEVVGTSEAMPSIGEPIVAEPVEVTPEPVETIEEVPTLDLSGVTEPTPVNTPTEETPVITVEELK